MGSEKGAYFRNYIYYKGNAITKNRFIEQSSSGNTVVFTDRTSGKIWSSTLNPNYSTPDSYSYAASLSSTKYTRCDGNIETITEVIVAPEYNMEIRKITLFNSSDVRREIVINTELELAMTNDASNIIHPAFNSLLIEEEYDEDLKALIATKRSRTNDANNADFYVYSKLVGIDIESEVETEKIKLTQNDGKDAFDGNFVRYPLWPVMAHKAHIFLDPSETQTFYYIVGAADRKYDIIHAIVNAQKDTLDKQISFADQKENILAKYLKLKDGKAKTYNYIVASTLFKERHRNNDLFWDKKYSQSMLWKFGISGDLPIITVKIGRIEDSSMVKEVISFMDYVKSRKLDLDVVLTVNEELYSGEPIKTHIQEILSKIVYTTYTRGNIYVVNLESLNDNEKDLFNFVSRFNIDDISIFRDGIYNSEKSEKESIDNA